MSISAKVYLGLTGIYFVTLLGCVSGSLGKYFKDRAAKTVKRRKSFDKCVNDISECVNSTQMQTERHSYKRTDLTIEIPEYEDEDPETGISAFFKQNCFPLTIFFQKSVNLKVKKYSRWFLILCVELTACLLLTNSKTFVKYRADYFIIGPMLAGLFGLVFSGVISLVSSIETEKCGFLVETVKVLGLFAVWTFGCCVNLVVEVRNRQPLEERDYLVVLGMTGMLEVFVMELVRTSIKLSLLVCFRQERISTEFIERI